jgi:hypothetical protein
VTIDIVPGPLPGLVWFGETPDIAQVGEYIDYAELSEFLVYGGERLQLDHSMLEMEDWMWARHQDRLGRFYESGVYA